MDKVFAAAVVVGCIVMLVRLLLGERRRDRVSLAWRRWRSRHFGARPTGLFSPRAQRQAERAAQEAIRRARQRAADGEWDGNVYKPKAFRKGEDKRNIH